MFGQGFGQAPLGVLYEKTHSQISAQEEKVVLMLDVAEEPWMHFELVYQEGPPDLIWIQSKK